MGNNNATMKYIIGIGLVGASVMAQSAYYLYRHGNKPIRAEDRKTIEAMLP